MPIEIPELPEGADETSRTIIPILLDEYVAQLMESSSEIHFGYEAERFFTLIEQRYPAATKDFVTTHILQHMRDLINGAVGRRRRQARQRHRIMNSRIRGRKLAYEALGIATVEDGTDEPIPTLYRSFGGVGGGVQKQIAAMNRADLSLVSKRYRTTAASSAMAAEFHERLLSRFPSEEEDTGETVADLWTETEVDLLGEEIFGDESLDQS